MKKRGFKNKTKQELREDWAELDIPDYDKWTIFSLTQFFYSVDPDDLCDPDEVSGPVELFEALIESLEALETKQQVKYQVDDTQLSLKYTVVIEDEKMEENEEESIHLIKVEYSIDVCVTVCKKEEGKYCLDFILMKGDRGAFIEHYKDLVENDD